MLYPQDLRGVIKEYIIEQNQNAEEENFAVDTLSSPSTVSIAASWNNNFNKNVTKYLRIGRMISQDPSSPAVKTTSATSNLNIYVNNSSPSYGVYAAGGALGGQPGGHAVGVSNPGAPAIRKVFVECEGSDSRIYAGGGGGVTGIDGVDGNNGSGASTGSPGSPGGSGSPGGNGSPGSSGGNGSPGSPGGGGQQRNNYQQRAHKQNRSNKRNRRTRRKRYGGWPRTRRRTKTKKSRLSGSFWIPAEKPKESKKVLLWWIWRWRWIRRRRARRIRWFWWRRWQRWCWRSRWLQRR